MIHSFLNWFRRRKTPTLRELARTTIDAAGEMNEALNDLANCDCTEGIRRVMDRARRMEGARTRAGDKR